jgi:CRISPR-associated protein Cmr3
MTGIPLPYPQAIAGFLRTRSSVDQNGSFVIPEKTERTEYLAALKNSVVLGPWLGLLDNKGQLQEHIIPAPRDAILFGNQTQKYYLRLGLSEEQALKTGEYTNMPDELEPIFLAKKVKDKPTSPPPLWRWSEMAAWLSQPQDQKNIDVNEIGINLPKATTRTGIRINELSQVVEEGALFSTEHREFFAFSHHQANEGNSYQKLCILASTKLEHIAEGAVPFAGKRRSVFLQKANTSSPIPTPPDGLLKTIANQGKARVILLTPGYFNRGWMPSTLLQTEDDVTVKLKAAIVPRPQTVSGWDLDIKKPKPTRRLVPAGSVYFIEIQGDMENKIRWLQKRWWQSISDVGQERIDGYGLAVFGIDRPVEG